MHKDRAVRKSLLRGLCIVVALSIAEYFLPDTLGSFLSKGVHTQNDFFTTLEEGWLIKFYLLIGIIGIIAAKK